MANSPTSLATLSEEELATVTRTESAVDKELRLKFEIGKAVAIRNIIIRPVLELNPRVLQELKDRFTAVGWEIVEYDSQEGLWLSFSEA